MENEIHGRAPNFRLKWSCKRCSKRNDNPVRYPPSPTEIFVCRGCKRAVAIGFEITGEKIAKPTESKCVNCAPDASGVLVHLHDLDCIDTSDIDAEGGTPPL